MVEKNTEEPARLGNRPDAKAAIKELDPVRLATDLRRWASGRPEVEVILTVRRVKDHEDGAHESLQPVKWDSSWEFDRENPRGISSPLAIPELGIAYQVNTTVEHVAEESPALKTKDKEGLQ